MHKACMMHSKLASMVTVWKNLAPHHTYLRALSVIMRVSRKSVMRVSEGGTRRPEDTSKATGEERDAAQSTPGCDDGARPNPTFGSHAPDGLSEEKNSTPLRKQINLATWNVRSMSTEKLEIVEQEMARCNIKILGVSGTFHYR